MMVLSMQTDYAILALGYLSRASDASLVTAREIAAKYHMPTELLAKILQRLAREGVIRSTPGPCGGYALARSLEDVSVADVLRIVDGPLHFVRCTGDACCALEATCDIVEPMRLVQDRVVAVLEKTRISEIVCAQVTAT